MAARCERHLAVDLPAVVDTGGPTDGGGDRGAAEVAGGEDLVLRLLRPPRPDHQRMVHGEPEAPRGRHASAGDLLHHPDIGRYVELIAAVAPRDVQVVEAGAEERLVHLIGVVGTPFGRLLIGDQARPERDRAGDHLLLGQGPDVPCSSAGS